MTEIIELTDFNFAEAAAEVAAVLKIQGNFILAPTETVYGLMALWNDESARMNIYKSKQRPENKPFQMLASGLEMVKNAGAVLSERVVKLTAQFCPGPITIIVPSNNVEKIGFRIPEHKFISELIKLVNCPLAATSANVSGMPPALNIYDALSSLKKKPNIAVDGGMLPDDSLASTVVEVGDKEINIIRKGIISERDIRNALN